MKVPQVIYNFTAGVHARWAKFMQNKFNRLTTAGQKLILIISCVFTTILCIFIITFAFTKDVPAFKVTNIHLPAHVIEPSPGPKSGKIMDEIRNFQSYLDTCKCKDSIMKVRPGLIDSINQLKLLYK